MKLSDLRAGLITAERIPLLFYIVGYLLSLSANINSNWLQHNAAARWLLALVVPLAILTLLAPPIVRRFLPLSPVPTARQHRAGECQGLVALVSSGDGAATARKAIEYHAATLRRIWLVHSPDSAAEADKLVDDLSRHERLSVRHFEKISLTDKAFGDPEAVRDAIEERVYRRPFEVLAFELPAAVADHLASSDAFDPGTVKEFTQSMPVKLADVSKCDTEPPERDHLTLAAGDKEQISRLLMEHGQRAPVVFVLDTGWPSPEAYRESRDTLYEVLDKVWQENFGRPFQKPAAQKTWLPASHDHCRCIERALRELRALDQGGPRRVRVIYVPMTREQGGSTILTDLLQTSDLLQLRAARGVALNTQIIGAARSYATALVAKHFPVRWTGDEVETDNSVMDAVLLIGQAYAEEASTVFLASESWTVRHDGKYRVLYDSPLYGVVTAAAGNDGTTHLLDFAQRSENSTDTMAVINMTPAGVAPDSTLVEAGDIDLALAAGFDGTVTDDVYGTSFSAPRIAWFLAAGEAVRTKSLDRIHWGRNLQAQLAAMRDPSATGYQKLLFHPLRYLQEQAKAPSAAGPASHGPPH